MSELPIMYVLDIDGDTTDADYIGVSKKITATGARYTIVGPIAQHLSAMRSAAPPPVVDDAMVERAARAMARGDWREPPYNNLHTDALNNHWRFKARAALVAALEVRDE
jgi:hypothetical protein